MGMERFIGQAALLALVTLFAWWRGGRPHRIVATTLAAMFLLTVLHALIVGMWSHALAIPYHRIALDIAALAIFLHAWLRSDRWWLLWVCSAQLLSVFAHLARLLALPMPQLGYAVMERWPVWLIIAITAVAIRSHAKEEDTTPSGS